MTLYDISDPASELFTEKVDYLCAKFLTWDPKFLIFSLAFEAIAPKILSLGNKIRFRSLTF